MLAGRTSVWKCNHFFAEAPLLPEILWHHSSTPNNVCVYSLPAINSPMHYTHVASSHQALDNSTLMRLTVIAVQLQTISTDVLLKHSKYICCLFTTATMSTMSTACGLILWIVWGKISSKVISRNNILEVWVKYCSNEERECC